VEAFMGIEVTLSDMDGTLIDAEKIYGAVDTLFMAQYNVHITAKEFDTLRGAGVLGFHNLFATRSEQFSQDYPTHQEFEEARIQEYYQMLQDKPELLRIMAPVMNKFKKQFKIDHPSLVITNSSMETVRQTMGAASIKDKFWKSAITSDYVLGKGCDMKPSGDPYTLGLARINKNFTAAFKPEECLVLEDSVVGVYSAMNFGGHVLHIIADDSQRLSEDEVDAIRLQSGFSAEKGGLCQSYTACTEDTFKDAYKAILASDANGRALKPYYSYVPTP
jgi:beta-phosphoglucomutase-like phosphatase (HAD superfamily)